ncbi:MAG: 4Fe-4S binding protein [Dehalococcoidia bacterium]|nr:4Fe-4S binding protein [Dehalococcoidia bacterium]
MADIAVDHKKCVQCGLCISLCDWHVLDTDDDDATVIATRPEDCTYCMLCQDRCYEEAIQVAAA